MAENIIASETTYAGGNDQLYCCIIAFPFRVVVDPVLGDDGQPAARPRHEAQDAIDDKRRQPAAAGSQDQEDRFPGRYAAELLTGKSPSFAVV